MSNQKIIELIKKGEHSLALDVLYQNYPAFKNSFIKAGGKKHDADDVFQDALLIFIKKVSIHDFQLTCSINSFLFGICKNLSLEYFRKTGKVSSIVLDIDESFNMEETEAFIEKERKYAALDKILKSVGRKCMEILELFYISGLKMVEIAEKLGFKSETSAKTQKYKCIAKARKLTEKVMLDIKAELA